MTETEEADMTARCLMRFALIVKKNAKSPSNPQKTDLYIAETVTKNTKNTKFSHNVIF